MPCIEYFRIRKEAQAVFEWPMMMQDVPKPHKWQRNYTTGERKHLLSRMLLHPSDSHPVPLKIFERTITNAVHAEDFCFKNASSTKHYHMYLAHCIRLIWDSDVHANFPVARPRMFVQIQH